MTTLQSKQIHQKIIRFYEETGLDYRVWSPDFNMHFGYYRKGMNPFDLEPMLNQMNQEVFDRLGIDDTWLPMILDAGCGLATTSRYMARQRPDACFYGVTITPWQYELGKKLNQQANLTDKVTMLHADYQDVPVPDESFDAAFAIESACYAAGKTKKRFIREMARIIRPGGRLVVADGFRKGGGPLPAFIDPIYKNNMQCWALGDLAEIFSFTETMESSGFVNIKVEDISWRVAPSFLHIPKTFFKFHWKRFTGKDNRPMTPERANNANAPLWGMLMGLARPYFGYYLVSGEKR